jgi:hypothetical protein
MCYVKASKIFAVIEDVDEHLDSKSTWEISDAVLRHQAKKISDITHESKINHSLIEDEGSELLQKRKQAKLHLLQNPKPNQ